MDGYWTAHGPSGEAGEIAIHDPGVMVGHRRRNDVTAKVMILDCYSNSCVEAAGANSGEAVMLFVTRTNPDLTEKDVCDFCGKELTGYKKPKYVTFIDEMPKTNVGKSLRRELRDAAVKQMKA